MTNQINWIDKKLARAKLNCKEITSWTIKQSIERNIKMKMYNITQSPLNQLCNLVCLFDFEMNLVMNCVTDKPLISNWIESWRVICILYVDRVGNINNSRKERKRKKLSSYMRLSLRVTPYIHFCIWMLRKFNWIWLWFQLKIF